MNEERGRRGLVAVLVLAIVCLIALLLGHNYLEGYLDLQRARDKAPPPAPSATAGASGTVAHADGSPAANVRVTIAWKDGAGRPGETPSLTDGAGAFAQRNVPAGASVTEVTASLGPLTASSAAGSAGVDGRVRVTLPATFRIAGLVRRKGDRAPVAGAAIEAGAVRAVSGAAGEFALDALPASLLAADRPVVTFTAEGFAPLAWPLPKDALPATYGDLSIVLEPAPAQVPR